MNILSIIALCIVGICFLFACIYLYRHRGQGNCSSCSGCSWKTCPHRNKKKGKHVCDEKGIENLKNENVHGKKEDE